MLTSQLDRQPTCYDKSFLDSPRQYAFITVHQLRELNCRSSHETAPHTQYGYGISCISAGKGWIRTRGKRQPMKTGDLAVHIPGEEFRVEADGGEPFRFFHLSFDLSETGLQETPFSPLQEKLQKAQHAVCKDRHGVEGAFSGAFNELRCGGRYIHLMLESYMHQILVGAYRNFFAADPFYLPDSSTGNKKEIVYNAVNYIDYSLLQMEVLGEISAALGYSYSYLSHIFREEMGMSLQSFYAERRIMKATRLLQDGGRSVTQIAELLQYQSVHSFSKAFKKMVGLSPKVYQELHQQGRGNLDRAQ
ncbi:AraC family transcriptional regulator [Paenibacillus sp. MBLB4367]|uniref:AraC family transcriptional regulator n=1 Tax=Paenibacillus sp. MBLB4367 TaxID=3384767 RepID=UPI003907FB10